MADVKTIIHPLTGKEFRLGRNRPIAIPPHLRLGNYMLRKMPAPPPTVNYGTNASAWLSQVLGNDEYGDCTIAAALHISGTLLINAGQPMPAPFDAATAIALYLHLTGGQDTGLDEQVVFNWWQTHGLLSDGSHKIVARVFVDPTDIEQIQTALWLFENLYFTASLPDTWVNPMPVTNGFTWGVAGDPDPDNGHAYMGFGYNSAGVTHDTWGLTGLTTYGAIAKYNCQTAGGGCYAVISQDAINTGTQKASNGFDWSQLQADIASFHS